MEQRSAAWFSARLGKLTGSRAAEAFAVYQAGKDKGKPKECANDYVQELAFERTTGNVYETKTTWAMQWGIDHEDEARAAYVEATGNVVTQVGFIDHHEINNFGASPDGLIGSDGVLEIKCPSERTHNKRLHLTEVPEEYREQMLVEMVCTGRKWCDYVDYDPRNTLNPLHIIHFEPKEEELKATEEKAIAFLKMVDEEEKFLRDRAASNSKPKEIWDSLDEKGSEKE